MNNQEPGVTTYIVSDEACPDGCHQYTVRMVNWNVDGRLIGHYNTLESALVAAGGFAETKRNRYGRDVQVALQIKDRTNMVLTNPDKVVNLYD